MAAKKKKRAPVIATLNLKGGVGKTTISAHLMRVLFEANHLSILLVDLDPQFNLSQTIFSRASYETLKEQRKTIMAVMEDQPSEGFFKVKVSATTPPSPAEIAHRLRWFIADDSTAISIVPGDFGLVKYSLMDDSKILLKVRARFLEFLETARTEYDLICIDCNPSSSFITLCALSACTHILVPVKPDRYSILGLEILDEFVNSVPNLEPKPEIIVLLNEIARAEQATLVETDLRKHAYFGKRTLSEPIYKTDLLRARLEYTGFATDRPVAWRNTVRKNLANVASELASKLKLGK